MSLTVERAPLLHPLSYLEDGNEYVVGRADIDSYGIFPPDGAALLQQLERGVAPADAARWYRLQYGEGVDIDEFLDTLDRFRFIVKDGEAPAAAEPVRWQRLGRAVFSPVAWTMYAVAILAAVAFCIFDPRLAPQRSNIFFTRYLVVVELTLFFGQFPLSLFHELFHVLAGRRLGIQSRVRLSHRYYFLVWETALDGLVLVPRNKRYLPMLAGMVADVLAMSVLTVVAAITRGPGGEISLIGGVCLALAFATLLRIAWQFYFYLKTDIYYLVSTVLGCSDLQRTARELLHNQLNKLRGRPQADPLMWHPRDLRVARWYAPLMVTGYAASTLMLLLVFLPLTWQFLSRAAEPLLSGRGGTAQTWDSIALFLLTVGQFALVGYLALRQRRRSGSASPKTGTPSTSPKEANA